MKTQYRIAAKRQLAAGIFLMDIEAPRLAQSSQPGQFLIVRAHDRSERIPLTICDYDAARGTVTIVIQVVGVSSQQISDVDAGGYFTDVAGPLGHPSEFLLTPDPELRKQRYLFVAGGVGTAPVYPQVKWLHEHGVPTDVIIGAKNAGMLILQEEMNAVANRIFITTDDGSAGMKGLVTDRLKQLLGAAHSYTHIVAIGPMVMMKFVALAAQPFGIPLTVSMNTLMVDGTGMCGACRVSVGGQTRFTCVDGPEFDGYAVNFDEAMRRQTIYKGEGCKIKNEPCANPLPCPVHAAGKARVKAREQQPGVRARNFEEVSFGFDADEAQREAARCLQCRKPKCVAACPVNISIPQFIAHVREGDYAGAARIIAADSSLPAVCGRVCPQETQCEGACILGIKQEPVNIGQLERFVADWSRGQGIVFTDKLPLNGKKIAVVGSGPAGLACATDLAKKGYAVTVFEALHKPGGVLEYGIPEFRLPKETVVKYEIGNLVQLGVTIETNVVVGRTLTVDDLFEKEHFDAVFIGSGAGLPKFMGIPGENLNGVFSANEFLTRNNLMRAHDAAHDTPVIVGKKVAVVGGGNVAMDAARTALRLGADVAVVYRRTEVELPARKEEVHHAKEEGVRFQMLTNPVEILADDGGWVRALRCVRMALGEPDESGRRSPQTVAGSEFDIPVDMVIMSLGTSPNPLIIATTPGLEANRYRCIIADEQGATTRRRVFAGGDAVTGAATVILAMGAGRKAAAAIDASLSEKN
ncbi:MAG: NADPH-dependent glutamate synthase [Prevotellaceae bacterium]|jgi:glutamate synthase (NADPH/NADH) small chain|nr:NADPH-dependent glutamate synthase [Prevotellaceae bacterium]